MSVAAINTIVPLFVQIAPSIDNASVNSEIAASLQEAEETLADTQREAQAGDVVAIRKLEAEEVTKPHQSASSAIHVDYQV